MDIPEKPTKEKRTKEKRVKEKPDEIDNLFKRILKKERDQQPVEEEVKNELEEKKPNDILKKEQLSEEEKQRILAAVDNDKQVEQSVFWSFYRYFRFDKNQGACSFYKINGD